MAHRDSMSRRKALAAACVGGLAALVTGSARGAAEKKFPRIHEGIRALEAARRELEEGRRIFGGHRVSAIKAIDEAIKQLREALAFAEKR